MSLNIVALETQNNGNDWPLIVMSVPCRCCNAAQGEMCRFVGRAVNPMMSTGAVRNDWHAERKHDAAQAWYAHKDAENIPPAEAEQVSTKSGELVQDETPGVLGTGSPIKRKKKADVAKD